MVELSSRLSGTRPLIPLPLVAPQAQQGWWFPHRRAQKRSLPPSARNHRRPAAARISLEHGVGQTEGQHPGGWRPGWGRRFWLGAENSAGPRAACLLQPCTLHHLSTSKIAPPWGKSLKTLLLAPQFLKNITLRHSPHPYSRQQRLWSGGGTLFITSVLGGPGGHRHFEACRERFAPFCQPQMAAGRKGGLPEGRRRGSFCEEP